MNEYIEPCTQQIENIHFFKYMQHIYKVWPGTRHTENLK